MIMKFDWEEFDDKPIVIYCKTEKEAKDFISKALKAGYKWYCSPNDKRTFWEHYKYLTCYRIFDKTITFCDRPDYKIVEWSDYMNKTFTKDDLKSGDFVVRRNGDVEVFIKEYGIFVRLDGRYSQLEDLNEDFTGRFFEVDDIIKIYRPEKFSYCCFNAYNSGKLVYDRKKEAKEVTIKEIEEKFGCKVKIVGR